MSEKAVLDNLKKNQLLIPQIDYQAIKKYLSQVVTSKYFLDDTIILEPKVLDDLQVADMTAHLFKSIHIDRAPIGVEGALRILSDPQMRRLLTCLALASITSEEMELILNNKFAGHSYTSEDIESYLHYFFNLSAFTYLDKRAYVELVGDPNLKQFYKLALTGDKDYLIWKLGAAPDKPYNEILKEMMLDSFYLFKENQKHRPEVASRWGQLAVKISDKLDKLEKETKDQQNSLEDFEFKTFADDTQEDTPDITPIWDLQE